MLKLISFCLVRATISSNRGFQSKIADLSLHFGFVRRILQFRLNAFEVLFFQGCENRVLQLVCGIILIIAPPNNVQTS